MINYTLRHINLLVITLFLLSFASFILAYLFPGDPLTNLSGQPLSQLSEAEQLALAQHYRIDENLLVQYWTYLKLLVAGDWGISFSSRQPLFDAISAALPASVELSSYGLLLSLFLGIPLGLFAGLKHHKAADYGLLSVSVISYSMPIFWLSLLGIMLFCLHLGWLPLSGRISLLYEVPHQTGFMFLDIWLSDMPNKLQATKDALIHLILPTLSITIVTFSVFLRIVRRSTIEVMPQGFIKAAHTRGLTHRQVFLRHGVRNALLPILPLLVPQFAALLTNTMIVEIIFSWPGLGNWLIQAIYQRDYPAIRAGMFVVSGLVVLFTITVEIFIRSLDPTLSKRRRASI